MKRNRGPKAAEPGPVVGGVTAVAAVAGVMAGGATRKPCRAGERGAPVHRGARRGRRTNALRQALSILRTPTSCRAPLAGDQEGTIMPLRMRVHDREPIGAALRRFKKLLQRSGLTKELRRRKNFEKPCEARRRAKLRKQSAIRKGKVQPRKGPYR